jgi:GcrA cell cycle regulator
MSKKNKKIVANLEANDCRWPIGDPREFDFHFCGEAKLPGRPYCAIHWQMAFQPPRSRGAAPVIAAPTRRAA